MSSDDKAVAMLERVMKAWERIADAMEENNKLAARMLELHAAAAERSAELHPPLLTYWTDAARRVEE